MAKKQTTEQKETKQTNGAKPVAKPVKAAKHQTSIALARQLLADKADDKKISAAFVTHFNARGKTDAKWIAKRSKIYMGLAAKSKA